MRCLSETQFVDFWFTVAGLMLGCAVLGAAMGVAWAKGKGWM